MVVDIAANTVKKQRLEHEANLQIYFQQCEFVKACMISKITHSGSVSEEDIRHYENMFYFTMRELLQPRTEKGTTDGQKNQDPTQAPPSQGK